MPVASPPDAHCQDGGWSQTQRDRQRPRSRPSPGPVADDPVHHRAGCCRGYSKPLSAGTGARATTRSTWTSVVARTLSWAVAALPCPDCASGADSGRPGPPAQTFGHGGSRDGAWASRGTAPETVGLSSRARCAAVSPFRGAPVNFPHLGTGVSRGLHLEA